MNRFPWLSALLVGLAIVACYLLYQESQRSRVSVQVGPSHVDVQWPDGRVTIP